MKYLLLILLTLFISLTSCERVAQVSFKIKNNTNSTLKVISTNTDPKTKTDTFEISVGSLTTIAVNQKGVNGVRYYKETEENLRDFTLMDIFKADTLKSKTNFLKTNRWDWKEINSHNADNTLTVIDNDF